MVSSQLRSGDVLVVSSSHVTSHDLSFQWLVKLAIATREEMGDFIRAFSESQFNREHRTPRDEEFNSRKERAIACLGGVKVCVCGHCADYGLLPHLFSLPRAPTSPSAATDGQSLWYRQTRRRRSTALCWSTGGGTG